MTTERNIPFSVDNLVDTLLPHVSTRGWEFIGRRALARSKRVAVPTFMFGPLTRDQNRRGPYVSDAREECVAERINDDYSTNDELKNEMLRIVRAANTINLFRLIIDPQDFGRSVENLFHLSCLFHDGTCGFHINDDEEPVVTAQTLSSDQHTRENTDRRQMVFEFDMSTWSNAIDVFEITEAVMPRFNARCVL